MTAHHPLLVLKINGKNPAGWPKDSETHQQDIGPYLISNPKFTPSFKIFSHADEAQIPWGVVTLEFRNEEKTFAAIAPRGPHRSDELVQEGYRIAQQNCFRCHSTGDGSDTKSGHPWLVLSAWATSAPAYFAAYVRNPQAKNPQSQMAGSPGYDDATIGALIAYFRTFTSAAYPAEKP
jgi:mono/diheme cytochrome c family protein